MSVDLYYGMCNRYKGRAVEIRTLDGRVHRGVIQNVNRRKVYLQPLSARRNLGGFGYGFYGPGFGWGYGGFGIGIALGAIGTLALLPFFLW
ncbi:hypothetical protein [Ornithinibacillus halophilus]|uniref:Uncharacterized protein n=1 Tax=Ornithinibacillus halophilus TaxID=930117 RepID=A0A1M5FKI6_9BACI|nr:hypothetical protein [Ornithinibacillus halophilus]SHF92127.1 hypothetical protein SAMN05216225_100921 [Ornithinibacillus halophilus]